MSSGAVDSLLRYLLINQSTHLVNGSYNGYTTALGNKVYGYGGTTDSNYFNGSQATESAITGSKATVYRLNTLLGVPYATSSGYLGSILPILFIRQRFNGRTQYDLGYRMAHDFSAHQQCIQGSRL